MTETKLPDISRLRQMISDRNLTVTQFCKECGIPRSVYYGILQGAPAQIDPTLNAIAGYFKRPVTDFILQQSFSNHLVDRISAKGLWPRLLDVVRHVVILSGATAMETYSDDSRRLISTGPGAAVLEALYAGNQRDKNSEVPADIDSAVNGINTADPLLRPIAKQLTCAVSFMAEELLEERRAEKIRSYLEGCSVPPAEEFFRVYSNVLRVLADLLDGSGNHGRGMAGLFCSTLGIIVEDQCRVAASFDPTRNVVFSAALMGPRDNPGERMWASVWEVSTGHIADLTGIHLHSALSEAASPAIAVHFPRKDLAERAQMIDRIETLCHQFDSVYALNCGGAAMNLVAQGGLAAFVNPSTNLHDVVAGEVICRAAGCKVTTWNGQPIDYTRFAKTSVIAAPEKTHGRLLETLTVAGVDGPVVKAEAAL